MNTGTSSASGFNLLEECLVTIGGKAKGPNDKDFEWFGGRLVKVERDGIVYHSRRTGKNEFMPHAHIQKHILEFERVGI